MTEELLETPTSLDELRSHEFDSLGRLTRSFHINGGWGGSEHYTHDPLGNLISRTATTGIGDRAYQPDVVDPDRLCRFALPGSSGPCTFTYDGMGNVVSDSTYGPMFERAFKYDPADRVTSIQRASYGAIFTYGPSGRVHTAIDGVDDRDSWSFGDLVEEHRKGADAFMERRIVGPLGIIATLRHSEREDTIVYTHGDGRANRFFTDDQGDVVQAAEYTTYGQASQTGGTDPLKTTDDLWNGGDDIPELGIVLLGPRVYDPDLGRFLQRDPIAITSRSSLANPYAFSFSDPVNHADPSGLMPTVYASTSWNAAAGRWVAGAAIGFMAAGSLWPQMPDLSLNAAFGVDDAVVSHVGGTLRQGWSDVLDPVGAAERCGSACSGGVLDEFIGGVSDGAFNAVENTVLTAYAWPYQAYRAGRASPGVARNVNDWAHDPVSTWKAMVPRDARGAGRLSFTLGSTLAGGKYAAPEVAGLLPRAAVAQASLDEGVLLGEHLGNALAQFEREGLTRAQTLRAASNPRLEPAYRGDRIDAFFKKSVDADPRLKHLTVTPRFRFGPDVFNPATKKWWDVTTLKQWGKHVQKYSAQFGEGMGLFY